MSITTKVGDKGTTFLFSGEEVPKDSDRTSAYGDLDELVSVMGVARASSRRADVRRELLDLQRALFIAGSEMATSSRHVRLLKQRIDAAALADLERRREAVERSIVMPKGFIVPGGTVASAHLDHARTIARRVERRMVTLTRKRLVRNPVLLVWINRVSDFLWLLARREEGNAVLLK